MSGITLFSVALFAFGALDRPPGANDSATTVQGPPGPALTERYNDPEYGFSFDYPAGFTVGAFNDHGANGEPTYTVLVQSDHNGPWFEVHTWQYWDLAPLHSERILSELESDGVRVEDPRDVNISDGIAALSLKTRDTGFPDFWEFWFASSATTYIPGEPLADIYRVRTSPEFGPWLASILGTWRFPR